MNKTYVTPSIEIIEYAVEIELSGASTTIDYPWSVDGDQSLFG